MKSQGAYGAYIIHEEASRPTPDHHTTGRRESNANCFQINIHVSISAINSVRETGAAFNVISFTPSLVAGGEGDK